MYASRLVLFRQPEDGLLNRFDKIFDELCKDTFKVEAQEVYACVGELLEIGASHGFYGNLWHCFLTYLMVGQENAYSIACEMRQDAGGSLSRLAGEDFSVFYQLFDYDFEAWEQRFPYPYREIFDYTDKGGSGYVFNRRIRDCICELSRRLEGAADAAEFQRLVADFYKSFGVGAIGLHKAFRVDEAGRIVPIANIAHVTLDDLIGCESQKKKLLDNTTCFVEGRRANNCLLFGDAGTGKSTCIKAIANQFYDRGLRLIEVYKHQFRQLNDVISSVKNRNYKFIIYMDDLSFEEFEIEYKYLKAVIEGGLEKKPDNVLIYATSNRRHLVRETFQDKAEYDDLHKNDTVQEKLSLYGRFGVTIYFGSPGKKEFEKIVLGLREKAGLSIPDDEILAEANKWELSHGGLSGRTAQQFIDYLSGIHNK